MKSPYAQPLMVVSPGLTPGARPVGSQVPQLAEQSLLVGCQAEPSHSQKQEPVQGPAVVLLVAGAAVVVVGGQLSPQRLSA